jgi:hypothetical protein
VKESDGSLDPRFDELSNVLLQDLNADAEGPRDSLTLLSNGSLSTDSTLEAPMSASVKAAFTRPSQSMSFLSVSTLEQETDSN